MAGVALSVVGDVDEKAADRGRKLLAADRAGEFQIRGCEITDAHGCVVEAFVKFVEDRSNGGGSFGFGFQGGELRLRELIVFGVGEEAIDASGNVANVKGHGGKTMGSGVEIILGEAEAPVVDVL